MTKAELSVKDLMINDWVNVVIEGEIYPSVITKMDRDTEDVKVAFLAVPGDWEEGDFFDEIQPIRINDDILSLNGWERTGGSSHRIYGEYNAVIFHWNENRKEIIIDKSGYLHYMLKLDILYVHELQHALRICGIDEGIKIQQTEK